MAELSDRFVPKGWALSDWKAFASLKRQWHDGGQDALENALIELRERDLMAWSNIVRALAPQLAYGLLEETLAQAAVRSGRPIVQCHDAPDTLRNYLWESEPAHTQTVGA